MREIKFRGKRVDNGEWVYGYYCKEDLGEEGIKHVIIPVYSYEYVDGKTVGQYTGLKDKNDKRIYEGSIVKYTFDVPGSVYATENGLKERISEVFWSDWRSSFSVYADKNSKLANNDLFRYVRNGNTVEIIGNIYDNPELLKESK